MTVEQPVTTYELNKSHTRDLFKHLRVHDLICSQPAYSLTPGLKSEWFLLNKEKFKKDSFEWTAFGRMLLVELYYYLKFESNDCIGKTILSETTPSN